jgi:hypothetical protein
LPKKTEFVILHQDDLQDFDLGLRNRFSSEEGPFLLEERTLIDVMARLIGEIIGPKLMKRPGGGA